MTFHSEGSGSSLTLPTIQSIEFKVNREYVGRIVGSGGSQINKIRDSLGVSIHVEQEPESAKESSKKKKEKTPQMAGIKVCA